MLNKRLFKKKLVYILTIVIIVLIVVVAVISKKENRYRRQVHIYDSYSKMMEDYSFLISPKNMISCETIESGKYGRYYIFNDYFDSGEKIIFHFTLLGENYRYEKKGLFKNINQYIPFPEEPLPNYAETNLSFTHYLSENLTNDVNFSADTAHEQIALSFNRPLSYRMLQEQFADMEYPVKFCWVDTFLPSDISDDTIYGLGIPPSKTYSDYSKYNNYKQAYGFMLYDHDYEEKSDFDNPPERFIKIISTQYDRDNNFMAEQIHHIHDNLVQKNELSIDSIKIIGVIIEKKDGRDFFPDEIKNLLESYDFL